MMLSDDKRILEVIEQSYSNCTNNSLEANAFVPLILVKSCIFGTRLISLPFMDVGGIFNKLDTNEIIKLKENSKKMDSIEIRLNTFFKNFDNYSNILTKNGFNSKDEKEQFYIRIEEPDRKWAQFHKHTRNDIRKAEKSNLELREIKDKKELKNFYKLYFEEMKRFGTPPHSFKFFRNLMCAFKEDFYALNCYRDKILIASGILILEKEVASLWFNVSNPKYREYRPNDLIYWTFIKKAHEKRIGWIDCGQIDLNSTEPHAVGLVNFKKKWLGEIYKRKYFCYSGKNLVKENSAKKDKLKRFRKIWSKLPSLAIWLIGPRIASQLG